MGLMAVIHRLSLWAEGVFDRLRPRNWRSYDMPPVIDAYRGFATPDGLVLRARLLRRLRRTDPSEGQRVLRNLIQMLSLFLTHEVAAVPVRAAGSGAEGLSDKEGYLWLEVPRGAQRAGWAHVRVALRDHPEVQADLPVLIPREDARFGVISDIDDTMMETGAYSILRNLWTSLTGNALTRHVYPDAVSLMSRLHGQGRNPVFYVSSSPWNLHAFLDRIFERAGLVRGPMFLRDLGLAPSRYLAGTHNDHKGSAIARVMAANPRLRFVLVGDTAQRDAQAYLQSCIQFPGRVAAILLREPRPGADAKSLSAIEAIAALGVPVLHDADFTGSADWLSRAGIPLDPASGAL